MHIFWIAGLLLALIDIPDFGNALRRIAGSTEKMAGMKPGEGADLGDTSDIELPGDAAATVTSQGGSRPGDGTAAPKPVAARRKELGHA